MKKILLIEDDEKKIDDVKLFILSNYSGFSLTIKEAYQSGLRELMMNAYDMLLLDMSLPTFETMDLEGVGSFEKFGGFKIMKEIARKKKQIYTVLITMFDDFGESDTSITLQQMDIVFKLEFQNQYKGFVFYNSKESSWKKALSQHLNQLLA